MTSLFECVTARGREVYRKLGILRGILRRATLALPAPVQLVIWDANLSTVILDALPPGVTAMVLPCRGEKYYLHPRVILQMIRIASRINGRLTLGWSELGYFSAVIAICGARTVVTYTDNSKQFYCLPEYCPDQLLVSIQNGWRSRELLEEALSLAEKPVTCTVLCISEYDRNLFVNAGLDPARVHVLGSLKAALAMVAPPIPSPRPWDVCLLSQWRGVMFTDDSPFKPHGDAVTWLRDYLARYAEQRGIKACVALATNQPEEQAFYEQAGLTVMPRGDNGDYLHSYRLARRSEMVISVYSYLGREALSLGTRVLFFDCELPNDPYADFPHRFSLIHRHQDYAAFEAVMDRLRGLDAAEYDALLQKENVGYFCAGMGAPPEVDVFTKLFRLQPLALTPARK